MRCLLYVLFLPCRLHPESCQSWRMTDSIVVASQSQDILQWPSFMQLTLMQWTAVASGIMHILKGASNIVFYLRHCHCVFRFFVFHRSCGWLCRCKSSSSILALNIIQCARNIPHVPLDRLGPVLEIAAFLVRHRQKGKSAHSYRLCSEYTIYMEPPLHPGYRIASQLTLRLPLKDLIISSHW